MRLGNRSQLSLQAFVAIATVVVLIVGCAIPSVAPYAPVRDPLSITPQGESVPVPAADSNPLEMPQKMIVNCSPQGSPLVSTPDIEACDAAPDCRVTCGPDTLERPE